MAPGEGTRPLADRVKQTLFAILEPSLRDARVLDLFAGSGAAGIEALSRGAAGAVFVDHAAAAVAAIHANLAHTHLAGPSVRVIRADALAFLGDPTAPGGPQDVVIVDPPYDRPDLVAATLDRLGRGDCLAPGGQVVVKHFWRDRPPERSGLLASTRERRFGETALTFYRAEAPGGPIAAAAPPAREEEA